MQIMTMETGQVLSVGQPEAFYKEHQRAALALEAARNSGEGLTEAATVYWRNMYDARVHAQDNPDQYPNIDTEQQGSGVHAAVEEESETLNGPLLEYLEEVTAPVRSIMATRISVAERSAAIGSLYPDDPVVIEAMYTAKIERIEHLATAFFDHPELAELTFRGIPVDSPVFAFHLEHSLPAYKHELDIVEAERAKTLIDPSRVGGDVYSQVEDREQYSPETFKRNLLYSLQTHAPQVIPKDISRRRVIFEARTQFFNDRSATVGEFNNTLNSLYDDWELDLEQAAEDILAIIAEYERVAALDSEG